MLCSLAMRMATIRRPTNQALIDAFEAAYDLGSPASLWLEKLCAAVRATIGALAVDVVAYEYDASDPCRAPRIGERSDTQPPTIERFVEGMPHELAHVLHPPGPFTSVSRAMAPRLGPQLAHGLVESLEHVGLVDTAGIVGGSADGRGVVLAALLEHPSTPTKRALSAWTRLAAHVAAASRLRRLFPGVSVTDGDRGSDDPLAEVARTIETASGSTRAAASFGVDLWQGLVDGRWSLIEHWRSDGRRLLVARENRHRDPRALTPRQSQVLQLAARGHDNILVGDQLGLSPSTVATHLAAGLERLRLRKRADLIVLHHSLCVQPCPPED
jgi:DNA-binding CsgD family transcriptional regulator